MYYNDFSRCLASNPSDSKIFVSKCDVLNPNQQWKWGFYNQTMIDQWDELEDFKFWKI
jgi:hypothetical protein